MNGVNVICGLWSTFFVVFGFYPPQSQVQIGPPTRVRENWLGVWGVFGDKPDRELPRMARVVLEQGDYVLHDVYR